MIRTVIVMTHMLTHFSYHAVIWCVFRFNNWHNLCHRIWIDWCLCTGIICNPNIVCNYW